MVEVASLEDVPLREVWPDEAKHFTPWLAQHPDHPGKALQMDLELEGDEMPVGPFSADVVLRDANTGHRVVVENLLETTDHDHLGKLIEWWAEFLPAFREAHPGWSDVQTPKPANWFSFPSGRSEVRYELSFAYPTGATNYSLRAEVYLPSGAPAYQALEAQRAARYAVRVPSSTRWTLVMSWIERGWSVAGSRRTVPVTSATRPRASRRAASVPLVG